MTSRAHQDPTGQAGSRQRATRDNNRRLNLSAKQVVSIFSSIKAKRVVKKTIKNNINFYEYESSISFEEIKSIIDRNLETESDFVPLFWYFSAYDEAAYRAGTLQENAWLAAILATSLTDDFILSSQTYREFIALIQSNDYRLIKGLSQATSNRVFQAIQSGIDAGLSKSAIIRKIVKSFETSKSSSERIVVTEINKAYNNARLNLIEVYRSTGVNLAVMHISALLPTTREWHASRHGKAYSVEDQRRWWNENSNRINCHCAVRSIELDRNNKVIDKSFQQRIIQQGKRFFKRD